MDVRTSILSVRFLPNRSLVTSEAVAEFATGSSPATAIAVEGSDDELTLDIDKILDVNSTICIEKEIAADTIGGLFQSTRRHFLPFVEQCTIELVSQLNHYYDGIRKSACDSLLAIVRIFYSLSQPQEWVPGQVVQIPLEPRVKELIGHVLPPLLDMYETEDNKYVCSSSLYAPRYHDERMS